MSAVGRWAEKVAAIHWFSNRLPQMHHYFFCMKSVHPWIWPVLCSNQVLFEACESFLIFKAAVCFRNLREYSPTTAADKTGGKALWTL